MLLSRPVFQQAQPLCRIVGRCPAVSLVFQTGSEVTHAPRLCIGILRPICGSMLFADPSSHFLADHPKTFKSDSYCLLPGSIACHSVLDSAAEGLEGFVVASHCEGADAQPGQQY